MWKARLEHCAETPRRPFADYCTYERRKRTAQPKRRSKKIHFLSTGKYSVMNATAVLPETEQVFLMRISSGPPSRPSSPRFDKMEKWHSAHSHSHTCQTFCQSTGSWWITAHPLTLKDVTVLVWWRLHNIMKFYHVVHMRSKIFLVSRAFIVVYPKAPNSLHLQETLTSPSLTAQPYVWCDQVQGGREPACRAR